MDFAVVNSHPSCPGNFFTLLTCVCRDISHHPYPVLMYAHAHVEYTIKYGCSLKRIFHRWKWYLVFMSPNKWVIILMPTTIPLVLARNVFVVRVVVDNAEGFVLLLPF